MRIACFTDCLPPRVDGVARSYTRLARTFQEQDQEFLFFSPFQPGPEHSWSTRVVQVQSTPFPPNFSYRFSLPYFQNISGKLRSFDPDVVHVSSPTLLGWSALRRARRLGCPAVAAYHTNFPCYVDQFNWLESASWSYLRAFYNRFDRVHAPSGTTASKLRNRGFQNVRLWRRGIDRTRFSPDHRSTELRQEIRNDDEPILLYVGRLAPEKNVMDLVTISKQLREKGPPFKLAIVGDGPCREDLEESLPNAVFPGILQGTELSTWYASADIFVFPSTFETFGNVVLEAFASELPVVVPDEGAVVELVNDGQTGLITSNYTPQRMVSDLQILLENASSRKVMGWNALREARRYTWSTINGELLSDYREVIKEQNMAA